MCDGLLGVGGLVVTEVDSDRECNGAVDSVAVEAASVPAELDFGILFLELVVDGGACDGTDCFATVKCESSHNKQFLQT